MVWLLAAASLRGQKTPGSHAYMPEAIQPMRVKRLFLMRAK